MSEYNGIVMIQVNNLSGNMEADEVKERVRELPQTYLAFTGSSGKSVKIWVRFTYPNDLYRKPVNRQSLFSCTRLSVGCEILSAPTSF